MWRLTCVNIVYTSIFYQCLVTTCSCTCMPIQAHWKGSQQRKAFKERLDYLTSLASVAVKVQIYIHRKQKTNYHFKYMFGIVDSFIPLPQSRSLHTYIMPDTVQDFCKYMYLLTHTSVCLQLQSFARMWRAKKAYKERLQFFRDHVNFSVTYVYTCMCTFMYMYTYVCASEPID